ncbi:MAG: hypothetical protein RLZZ436_3447 [Planctomycetota bacterium]
MNGYIIGTSSGPSHWTLLPLSVILRNQESIDVSVDTVPILPWNMKDASLVVRRVGRLVKQSGNRTRADLAGFLLPYLEAALNEFENLKVLHVSVQNRSQMETEFIRYLDRAYSLPTNYWCNDISATWHFDPIWSRAFPKYETHDRREAISRYCHEYEEHIAGLRDRFPGRICIVDRDELFKPDGIRKILSFLKIPEPKWKLIGPAPGASAAIPAHPRLGVRSVSPMDPQRCCILVPCSSHVHHQTEAALRQLEDLGYPVRRRYGVSLLDQARSSMATQAIMEGFEETLWIDADMVFDVGAVEQIRFHHHPIVAGLYSKRGGRALTSVFSKAIGEVILGEHGSLVELQYAATGFLRIRRDAYITISQRLALPVCNEMFGNSPVIPFFEPMTIEHEESHWSLGEDYSFSERARRAGLTILADTTLRLWHVGDYCYGWEDVGTAVPRSNSLKLHCNETVANSGPDRSSV